MNKVCSFAHGSLFFGASCFDACQKLATFLTDCTLIDKYGFCTDSVELVSFLFSYSHEGFHDPVVH